MTNFGEGEHAKAAPTNNMVLKIVLRRNEVSIK